MSEGKATWLPNLVGGVSIWKLAEDLNQPRFFDGRLLEPEVEGAESLPTRVVWETDRLVPLADARGAHGQDVDQAVRDFLAAVERVGKELASPTSGFRKFREAFSVPSLEGEGAASYFYDPAAKKLLVANWGASPRTIAGHGELVFGFESFDRLVAETSASLGSRPAGVAVGAAMAASAGDAGAPPAEGSPAEGAPAEGAAAADKAEKAEKEEGKKPEAPRKRPLWVWILAVLVGVAAVILVLFLLRECRDPDAQGGPDAGVGDADADAGDADAGDADTDADASEADADAGDADADAGDADADAGDADADAGDADADAGDADPDAGGADASADAGGEGSGGDPVEVEAGGGPAKVGGDGSGLGQIFVVPGGAGPAAAGPPPQQLQSIPFRSHFQPGAASWRITTGGKLLNKQLRPRMNEGSFEVFLEPGASFSQVQVEWKDGSGKWHVH